jgi:prephenate dehydratase
MYHGIIYLVNNNTADADMEDGSMAQRSIRMVILAIIISILMSSSVLANVSYLGPAGTYTEEASIKFFGDKETFIPVPTVPGALAKVKSGECQYAVVPMENTIGGVVYNYMDAVLADNSFAIIGEVQLPIRQTLLALDGATLQDISTVLSHPQGIAQSKAWLQANLPNAKVVEVSSTAEGAQKVAEGQDKSVAAIAASRTSLVYNLNILANDLQYTDTNVTRFWVVTLKEKASANGEKSVLTISGSVNEVSKLLAELDKKNYKLFAIHDRPTKIKMGEYLFVVELIGLDKQNLAKVCAEFNGKLKIARLGTFNVK